MGNHLPVFIWEDCLLDRIIETPRLVLRPLDASDAEVITAKINDYEISGNLARVPFPYRLADAVEFLDLCGSRTENTRFSAICLKQTPAELQGCISYEWNAEKADAELGYWLVRPLWGRGLMTEATAAMVRHAFKVATVETLVSCYFDSNPVSGKVLYRAGFEAVASCTAFSRAQGKNVPVTNMRLTRERWLAQNTLAT